MSVPSGPGAVDDTGRSERGALGVTATGVLILSAPTALQVTWLIVVAVTAVVLLARTRRRGPHEPPPNAADGDDLGDLP